MGHRLLVVQAPLLVLGPLESALRDASQAPDEAGEQVLDLLVGRSRQIGEQEPLVGTRLEPCAVRWAMACAGLRHESQLQGESGRCWSLWPRCDGRLPVRETIDSGRLRHLASTD